MTNLQQRSPRRPPGWVPDFSTFGGRLAAVRQAMGWTNIKEAATECAIAVESWRRWETGVYEPRQLVNACMKISGVTGVDYRWLALGPDDRTPSEAAEAVGHVTGAYGVGARLVTSVSRSDGRAIRTRPIDDRHLSLGRRMHSFVDHSMAE